jgi:hypothetical protein
VDYLDFEVEILPGESGDYTVNVRSEFGDASGTMRMPFDKLALENRLQALQIALLRSAATSRRVPGPEEAVVQKFGEEMFDALFADGPIRGRFEAARDGAWQRQAGVRVRMRIAPPELAALPWEYLYDPDRGDFLGLSIATPLVRYVPLPRPVRPLATKLPLRILGMTAASYELPSLDVAREQQRLDVALKPLLSRGLVELEWITSGTWQDLQAALFKGPWHIFHFIGHGGFDQVRGEGFLYLSGEGGRAFRLPATSLGRLLGDHDPMRLVILNSCEGSRGDNVDVFSSTAAVLVRRGTPGVVAMQYPITDRAAIEFSRSFYGAIVAGTPIDTAIAVARQSISLEIPGTLEWGTPTLFLRAPDGVLFEVPPLDDTSGGPAQAAVTAALPPPPPALQPERPAMDPVALGGPAVPQPIASPNAPQVSTDATPAADARALSQSEEQVVSQSTATLRDASATARRAYEIGRPLIVRGWQTGHVQTLIGALLGGLAAVAANLAQLPNFPGDYNLIRYVAAWTLVVAGAAVALRLAGPARWWRTVVVLALLFPLFRFVPPDSVPDAAVGVTILALVASTVPLLKRPQAP